MERIEDGISIRSASLWIWCRVRSCFEGPLIGFAGVTFGDMVLDGGGEDD